MLSRIAESLFWVGRYLERAEDTARVLDAHLSQMMEASPVDETTACEALLAVMEAVPPAGQRPDVDSVTQLLAYEDSNLSSIVGSISAAREGARSAREAISSEMWEGINSTHIGVLDQRRAALAYGPAAFFRYVRIQGAAIWGLADNSMSRDDAWRFMVLGRSLERIDMTARLLTVRYSSGSSSADWVTTLRCSSAHEAYLRTYKRSVDPALVIEFLLLDRLFPRSVLHTLGVAETVLDELDLRAGWSANFGEARRLLGRARTELEFRQVDELLDGLTALLERLQDHVAEASDEVAEQFFLRASSAPWRSEQQVVVR